MPERGYILTDADRALLVEALYALRKTPLNTTGRRYLPEDDHQAPELYVALTPADGIPARVGFVPGSADCRVWQIAMDLVPPQLVDTVGLLITVFNIGLVAVDPLDFVIIQRDKFGRYVVTERGDVGSPGTGTGTDHPCDCPDQVTNVYVTDIENNTYVGEENRIYYFYDSVTNTFTSYVWLCRNGVCGWFNQCTCEWIPFDPPWWCVDDTLPAPWWCVRLPAGTGTAAGTAGTGGSAVDCPACPGGAPGVWNLTVPTPVDPTFALLGGFWALHWITSPDYTAAGMCVWTSASAPGAVPRWTLYYRAGTWTLAGQVRGDRWVRFATGVFSCCGNNTLTFSEASAGESWPSPTYLTVTPVGDCGPPHAGTGTGTAGTVLQCVQSQTRPDGTVSGPYDTSAECDAACVEGGWA